MKFQLKFFTVFFIVTSFSVFSTVYAQITKPIVSDDSLHKSIEIIGEKINPPFPPNAQLASEILHAQQAKTSDTAQLLQNIPGISLYSAGGISSLPVIHGLADDRVRVQIDGMGLMPSCPNHMNSPLSVIDPTNVDNINVFAGITPVSAGGDSIGGTILVNSAKPEFATKEEKTIMKGRAGTFYRSNGDGIGGNLSLTYATDWFNLTYNGSVAKSKNTKAARNFKPSGLAAIDRGWLAGNEIGSSAYKAENHELGFAMRHDHHLIEFKASVQKVPYELFPNQRMDMTGNKGKQFNLHYKGKYQWGDLDMRVFEQITQHQMQFGENKQLHYGTALGMPMESEGKTKGASMQAEIFTSNIDTVKLGGEILHYQLNDWWPASMAAMGGMGPENFQNINNGQRNRLGLYGEWDANWNTRWFSQLGIRSETIKMNTGNVHGYNSMAMYGTDAATFNAQNHHRTDHHLDLTARARYTPSATGTLEFGYAQKTRSPNLYERYTWSAMMMASTMNNFSGDGNGYIGNINLSPEVAHTVSATWDSHDKNQKAWQLKVAPYYTYVTDYIDAQRCPISFSTNCSAANLEATTGFVNLRYINQTAQLTGIDISGYTDVGHHTNWGHFMVTGMINYVRGKNLTTGDNLYNIMPLNAKVGLIQKIGRWTNSAELRLISAKTHASKVRNENQTSGVSLFNLSSSYTWKNARFDISVENVFNRFYYLPLGGAYVGQGKTMSANGIAWGVPVPGIGRSLNTTVSIEF